MLTSWHSNCALNNMDFMLLKGYLQLIVFPLNSLVTLPNLSIIIGPSGSQDNSLTHVVFITSSDAIYERPEI